MHWYALHVRNQHEKLVHDDLIRFGIQAFHPSYQERRRWSDRQKLIDVPLFPGYLFAQFEPTNAMLARIQELRGVVRVLGDTYGPIPVSETEISAVRTLVMSGKALTVEAVSHEFHKGEKVAVMRGPFRGAEGTVSRTQKATRLIITLPLINRSISVEIDASCLRTLDRGAHLKAAA